MMDVDLARKSLRELVGYIEFEMLDTKEYSPAYIPVLFASSTDLRRHNSSISEGVRYGPHAVGVHVRVVGDSLAKLPLRWGWE